MIRSGYHRLASRFPLLGRLRINRLIFGNIRPLRTNIAFWLYHHQCRVVCARDGQPPVSGPALRAARELRQQGFAVFEPRVSPDLPAKLSAKITLMVERGDVWLGEGLEDWFIHIRDVMRVTPEIIELLHPEIVETIEEYFKSHFKIYSAEVYRTVPSSNPPDASGLWHTDNYPPGVLKMMVYLTRCDRYTGALRLHPRPSTRRLMRRGFFRRQDVDAFANLLESGWVWIEGLSGTTLLWDSNLVHRATPPQEGIRDVVAFKLLPSKEPWNRHLARVGEGINYERRTQIPTDPAAD